MSHKKKPRNRPLTESQLITSLNERFNSLSSNNESDFSQSPTNFNRSKRLVKTSSHQKPEAKKDIDTGISGKSLFELFHHYEIYLALESIDDDHCCSTFITKIKNDSNMTFKPDWSPLDINRRLSYKTDKNYTTRQKERRTYNNMLEDPEFRSVLILGQTFLCCVRTENLDCESSNKETLRKVCLYILIQFQE